MHGKNNKKLLNIEVYTIYLLASGYEKKEEGKGANNSNQRKFSASPGLAVCTRGGNFKAVDHIRPQYDR